MLLSDKKNLLLISSVWMRRKQRERERERRKERERKREKGVGEKKASPLNRSTDTIEWNVVVGCIRWRNGL